MMFSILVTEPASIEEECSYLYYERLQSGLGNKFLHALKEKYIKISENPFAYSFIDSRKQIRCALVHDFPFLIIFDIIDEVVIVLSVHNTHKRPKKY